MEPFSALTVATSAVQFIDFTSKLIAKSYELHTSTTGRVDDHVSLEQVSRNLKDLSLDLSTQVEKQSINAELSRDDGELQNLCKTCHDVSVQLLGALEKLKLEGEPSKWKSFRQALRTIWTREHIEGLERRLDRSRQQLILSILVSFRNPTLEADASRRHLQDRVEAIAESSDSLGQLFLKHISDSARWRSDLIQALRASYRHDSNPSYAAPSSMALEFYQGDRASTFRKSLLLNLRYREIENRFERIPKAHENTFQWIFEESETWQSFSTFLKDDTNIYWITGKAGAGKSTLMKYLFRNQRTLQLLSSTHVACLQKLDLVHAGFFFWNSGTAFQTSREGLLRTLLYKALEQCEDLFPGVFPHLWEAYYLFNSLPEEEWTWIELVTAFRKLLKAPGKRFFFLIDGLDEFDNDESKIRELIDFLKSIADLPNVKLCVASRPWVIFEDSFTRSPSLMLENLTYADMKHYVQTKLQDHPGYQDLKVEEPGYVASFVEEIVRKSAGVFLWVTLVVSSLLAGITNGDRIVDLEQRLAALPGDLEELFSRILGSIDPLYKRQASKLFVLVRTWNSWNVDVLRVTKTRTDLEAVPLTLLQLYLADLDDVRSAASGPIKQLTKQEQDSKLERMRRRVNSRCKGLLESSKPSSNPSSGEATTVEYLHRTVKDFIEQENTWNGILQSAGFSYDPNVQFCASFLLRIKTSSRLSPSLMWKFLEKAILYAARSYEESRGAAVDSLALILDDLDRSIRQKTQKQTCLFSRDSHEPSVSHFEAAQYPEYIASFLEIALQHGLDWFVQDRISKDWYRSVPQSARPLLICIIKDSEIGSVILQVRPRMAWGRKLQLSLVNMLLEAGYDPNCTFDGQSPLDCVEERLRRRHGASEVWEAMSKLLIQYGATSVTDRVEKDQPTGESIELIMANPDGPTPPINRDHRLVKPKREKRRQLSILFSGIFKRNSSNSMPVHDWSS